MTFRREPWTYAIGTPTIGQGVWCNFGLHQPFGSGLLIPNAVRGGITKLYGTGASHRQWKAVWPGFRLIFVRLFRIIAQYQRHREAIMGGTNSGRKRSVHRGAVEQFPVIDMRVLKRAGLLQPGE